MINEGREKEKFVWQNLLPKLNIIKEIWPRIMLQN